MVEEASTGTSGAAGRQVTLSPATLAGADAAATLDLLTRLDAVLPGRLISYAFAAGPEGDWEIYLLVSPRDYRREPEEVEARDEEPDEEEVKKLPSCPEENGPGGRPTALFRLRPDGEGGLVPVRRDLPPDATAIDAADLDGDG